MDGAAAHATRSPVDADDGLLRIDAHAHLAHDAPVDLDPPLRDQLLAGPATADASRSEHLLQTDAFGRATWCSHV